MPLLTEPQAKASAVQRLDWTEPALPDRIKPVVVSLFALQCCAYNGYELSPSFLQSKVNFSLKDFCLGVVLLANSRNEIEKGT